jgi:hypothetical protein
VRAAARATRAEKAVAVEKRMFATKSDLSWFREKRMTIVEKRKEDV